MGTTYTLTGRGRLGLVLVGLIGLGAVDAGAAVITNYSGIGAFNTLLYSGLQQTTALNAMLLQSGQPALILFLGAIFMGDSTTVKAGADHISTKRGRLARPQVDGPPKPAPVLKTDREPMQEIVDGAQSYPFDLRRAPRAYTLQIPQLPL